MKKVIFLLMMFASQLANAGEIADVFGKGVFDVNWGQDFEQVKNVHQNSKKKGYGNIAYLEVKDGRKVLGVERRSNDKIVFTFDSEGRLNGAGVFYESDQFGDLLNKLNTSFGPHKNKDTSMGVVAEWAVDIGIKISLSHISYGLSSDVTFSIEYLGLDKPPLSKKELGF